jgi:hypothetical protein
MKPATRDAMTEQPCHDTLAWLISFSLDLMAYLCHKRIFRLAAELPRHSFALF